MKHFLMLMKVVILSAMALVIAQHHAPVLRGAR
jgi:cell division protein FtsL